VNFCDGLVQKPTSLPITTGKLQIGSLDSHLLVMVNDEVLYVRRVLSFLRRTLRTQELW